MCGSDSYSSSRDGKLPTAGSVQLEHMKYGSVFCVTFEGSSHSVSDDATCWALNETSERPQCRQECFYW